MTDKQPRTKGGQGRNAKDLEFDACTVAIGIGLYLAVIAVAVIYTLWP